MLLEDGEPVHRERICRYATCGGALKWVPAFRCSNQAKRAATVPFHAGMDIEASLLRQIAKDIGVSIRDFLRYCELKNVVLEPGLPQKGEPGFFMYVVRVYGNPGCKGYLILRISCSILYMC